jgi:hypothetical protein
MDSNPLRPVLQTGAYLATLGWEDLAAARPQTREISPYLTVPRVKIATLAKFPVQERQIQTSYQ